MILTTVAAARVHPPATDRSGELAARADSSPDTDASAPRARARRVPVGADARACSTLAHIDYADAFVVGCERAPDLTAEQWAHAIFDGAPAALRRALRRGWFWLGLKLDRAPAERSVLGWEVKRSEPDLLLLGAGSRIGMPAELLLRRERDALLFSTLVEHDNALVRAIWARVEEPHLRIVALILERGVSAS